MAILKGQGVSPGKMIGQVYKVEKQKQEVRVKSQLTFNQELVRLEQGIEKTRGQLDALYSSTLERLGEEEASIFSAHVMMLDDPELLKRIKEIMVSENNTAEGATEAAYSEAIVIFEALESEYMQARAADLRDVSVRVIRNILNSESADAEKPVSGMIYCAEDITPSEVAELMQCGIKAFLTEKGGATSHFVIMANALEIPTLIQCKGLLSTLEMGDMVLVDADEGTLVTCPDHDAQRNFQDKMQKAMDFKRGLAALVGLESVSLDGCHIEIAGNIGTPADCESVVKQDGEAIGLFRTEFLFFDRLQMPSEAEQFDAYR